MRDHDVTPSNNKRPAHSLSHPEIVSSLRTDAKNGLSREEADHRLHRFGFNMIEKAKASSVFTLLLKQLTDVMVVVLLIAAGISYALGEMTDALTIVAIVLINAMLGLLQQYRAERSLQMLKQMASPKAQVKRDGRLMRIDAKHVVPGDLLTLKEGDRIPCDARLFVSASLKTDESTLTGESTPVTKDAGWTGHINAELAERKNMVYMGTNVVKGRAEGIVVATGMHTEIGDIATMISETNHGPTPLEQRLNQLGKGLVIACLLVITAVFFIGVWRGFGIMTMFFTGVSLAVAAIPESLPAVVTVALALGVQRMIKRRAIIRTLPAIETLGCITVICSDKTGTLTKNEMTVTRMFVNGDELTVTGSGNSPSGKFVRTKTGDAVDLSLLRTALTIADRCNDAQLIQVGSGRWRVSGDPTEGALKVLARKGGIDSDRMEKQFPRVNEIPFDSDRKRMSVVIDEGDRLMLYLKGAPGPTISRCRWILQDGVVRPLQPKEREQLAEVARSLAGEALRVLALALRDVTTFRHESLQGDDIEDGLTFVGLVGMIDMPRPEASYAISKAKHAGIETMMVTGDHPTTAAAIGRQLGIPADSVVTGPAIDQMKDEELTVITRRTHIYARVSPRHKLRIIKALKEDGHIVAMTGDGVNDAPAVKEADVGISMGLNGTDVTREAGDVILSDDNYATIVAAVEEGRGIYDNVRKFIRYLLACNTGEVLAMLIATFFGMPLPLLPIQILWVNLVTDGLPALALGVDPPEKDVMKRPPRHPREGVFARRLHTKIAFRGTLIALCTIGAFILGPILAPDGTVPLDYARTLALTTLVLSQLVFVFQCRSEYRPLHEISFMGNKWLVLAVAVSLSMHVAILYIVPLQHIFGTVPLTVTGWLVAFVFSAWSQLVEIITTQTKRLFLKRISVVKA